MLRARGALFPCRPEGPQRLRVSWASCATCARRANVAFAPSLSSVQAEDVGTDALQFIGASRPRPASIKCARGACAHAQTPRPRGWRSPACRRSGNKSLTGRPTPPCPPLRRRERGGQVRQRARDVHRPWRCRGARARAQEEPRHHAGQPSTWTSPPPPPYSYSGPLLPGSPTAGSGRREVGRTARFVLFSGEGQQVRRLRAAAQGGRHGKPRRPLSVTIPPWQMALMRARRTGLRSGATRKLGVDPAQREAPTLRARARSACSPPPPRPALLWQAAEAYFFTSGVKLFTSPYATNPVALRVRPRPTPGRHHARTSCARDELVPPQWQGRGQAGPRASGLL